ncbi:MAG: ATP-binding cassette domain-containing protein [bacterium]
METPVLEIRNLTKSYGHIKALDDFSLSVGKGEICGILGPNGSGKTTTLGILLDILKPDSGSFYWFGKVPDDKQRRRIGALLESPVFYPHLSAVRNLKIIADIKKIPYDEIDQVIHTVGLLERKHSRFSTYSMGMRQRLAIGAALLGKPEVLILDEPTNGLDPKGIAEIRKLIMEIGKEGVTILLASHLLDEVQKVCSHVVILEKGKKISDGRVHEVLSEKPAFEMASDDHSLLKRVLEDSGKFAEVTFEDEQVVAVMKERMSASEVNRFLTEEGIYLSHLTLRKQSLEKYFLELLK